MADLTNIIWSQILGGGNAAGIPRLNIKLIDNGDGSYSFFGTGGGGVQSVTAGDGIVLTGTAEDPIISATADVLKARGVLEFGSVAGFSTGNYLGVGRQISNSFTNTDPLSDTYGSIMNRAGTLRDLTILCNGDATDPLQPNTYTVYKNGVATDITITITAGRIGSDNVNTVDVLPEDIIMIKCEEQHELDLRTGTISYEFD